MNTTPPKTSVYKVQALARVSGVSVRTLHHYDALGLLTPSHRSDAGHRLYTHADLLRLQQVLLGRELGLSLEDIKRSLDEPGFDHRAALLTQRRALEARLTRTHAMLRAVDTALQSLSPTEGETTMTTNDETTFPSELFGGFTPDVHEGEARERWGDTDAYKESRRRSKRYSQEDWRRFKIENDAVYADAAALLKAGTAPDAEEAKQVAERHRLSIDRWFYPCDVAMHGRLADLYEADSRFAQSIDAHGEGLTSWLCAAIRANRDSAV